MSEEVISKSKQKREARKEEVKKEKNKATLDSIIGWAVALVITALVITVIVLGIRSSVNSTSTTASSDYAFGLTAEGYVSGAKLDKVSDLDLDNLVIPYSEVEFTDEDVEKAITEMMTNYNEFDTSSSLTVAEGDTINLDYVGYVDDVAFDGGNTNGKGTTLTIGSGSYIDTFEEQLIGSHPGDEVIVNVTFPDPYTQNPDLAGKPAKFVCTINSVEVTPEFNDAFVAKNLAESASNADEYRAYVKKVSYENNVKTYISTYVVNNASAKGISKSYLENLKGLIKYNDIQTFNYYNQFYYSYFGAYIYSSFNDYTQMTDAEYEANLTTEANKQAAGNLTYEKYFKDNNLSISDETYEMVLSAFGEGAEETYTKSYLTQAAMKYTVVEHLAGIVKVQ